MKKKNYFILSSLIFVFGIMSICAVSELCELRPMVASFFYCFDGEPGIIYYRKLFNQCLFDLHNKELYRNKDQTIALKK